jgi:hypothetical protein
MNLPINFATHIAAPNAREHLGVRQSSAALKAHVFRPARESLLLVRQRKSRKGPSRSKAFARIKTRQKISASFWIAAIPSRFEGTRAKQDSRLDWTSHCVKAVEDYRTPRRFRESKSVRKFPPVDIIP